MKKFLLPLLLLAIHAHAQQAVGVIENPTLRCHVTSTGDLFNPFGDNTLPGFEAPINSDIRAIYAANFWIAGLTSDGQIKIAAEQYQAEGTDWFCGPLTNDGSASTTPEVQALYNRVWTGNRAEVLVHQEQFAGGTPDPNYVVPEWMLGWPAHGNVAQGFDYYLAPFFDFNLNNAYDPENGDYPLFCGDRCLLWIFNDNGGPHTETGGLPVGVQVIATAYVFDAAENQNAIYFNYLVKNMSATTLNDTYVGWFTDFDLGQPTDDYLGTWVSHNAIYAFNGDDFDETNGTPGYGEDLAMSAFVLLNGPTQDADEIDNPMGPPYEQAAEQLGQLYPFGRNGYGDGIIDNEHLGLSHSMLTDNSGPEINLNNPTDYYNRLRSIWSSGIPVTYGEDGQNPNNVPANYMYTHNTDPGGWGTGTSEFDWTEVDAGNMPGERRAVGSSGPFTFTPGETMSLDFAYVFVRDSQQLDGLLNQLYSELVNVHEHFQEDLFPCAQEGQTLGQNQLATSEANIYPNPSSDAFMVKYPTSGACTIQVFDATGQRVLFSHTNLNSNVDVRHLAPGIYQIIIEINGHSTHKKLLITQR